jgi:glycosyltransferase involved in cell wall biosynthesis
MRIGLIYLGRHGPGGPISFELATHLSKKANLFAVVSQNSDHVTCWRESGLRLIEVPTFKTTLQAFLSHLNSARVRKLAEQISALRPDVLLWPMVHPWTPALQKYLAEIPTVTTVHDPAAHPGFIHRMSSLWERRSARMASRCVVLGQTFVQEMQARGIPKDKIDVIPHAIFSFYDRFSQNAQYSRIPHSLLFFGRITQYKGLDVLIRALEIAQVRWPDLHLQIVGEGDMRPYRSLVDRVKNVTVVNRWVDDAQVPVIFRAASAVVVPYTSASQSGVIALAANFGRPVIATRVGAIPEQIRDRETGLLVEPGSAEALASAIESLLTDDDLRQRVAERLALEMREKCNWSATSDAYLESCRKAILG